MKGLVRPLASRGSVRTARRGRLLGLLAVMISTRRSYEWLDPTAICDRCGLAGEDAEMAVGCSACGVNERLRFDGHDDDKV